MKRITCLGLVVVAGVAAGCLVSCSSAPLRSTATSPVARWHFVGAAQLQSQTLAPALAAVLNGTNSAPAADRLATNLVRVLWQRVGGREEAQATAVLAPLMRDLLRYESTGEVTANGWRLNVKLPANRWPQWQQAQGALAGLSVGTTGTVLSYTNGWLTAGAGGAVGAGGPALTNGAVLAGEADLARIFGGATAPWPRARLGASLVGGKVLTQASLDFSTPPIKALPAWRLPERMAHGPFSQFVAVRGIDELAGRVNWWRESFGGHPPDQMFAWAQPEVPFRNWVAVPTADATGDLGRWFALAKEVFSPAAGRSGRAAMATNNTAFAVFDTLKGLQPVVTQVKQGGDTFLLGSLYPADKSTNSISASLRRRLAEKDLVYQDAEFTPESVEHWNVLFQVNQILQSHLPNARNARAHAWMIDNRAVLGDSETVVRQVTPNRYALERTSSAGVTGLELVLLTRWLDGNDLQFRRGNLPPTPPDSTPRAKP